MGFFKKMFGKEEQPTQTKSTKNEILAILDGVVKPITESEDPVFAQKMMGDGYLIEPTGNTIVSPVDGVIQVVFPTKHAVGIQSDNGDEIIIHVGLDTVKLDGEGFTTFVEVNDRVKAGDKLLEVDFDAIKGKVPSIATPVVITNLEGKEIILSKVGETVTAGTVIAEIK